MRVIGCVVIEAFSTLFAYKLLENISNMSAKRFVSHLANQHQHIEPKEYMDDIYHLQAACEVSA
jgi:hypothetical protein